MEASSKPLCENEVGILGELAQRPNPENLIILAVPAIEELLPSLQKQLGRDLTPQEIEVQRRKSPAIAVSRAIAENMTAARAARPAIVQADSVVRPPTLSSTYDDMPIEAVARVEVAVDVFGQHLFSLRNQLIDRLHRIISTEDLRMRIGTLHRKEYDAVAALGPVERDGAIALARKAVDIYMQYILALLTGTGDEQRFGDDHAVNYRLVLEVKSVKSDEVVEGFDINRDCKRVIGDYFGRWLNRYGNHK